MSNVLEETTFDEDYDNPNGSTVFSPGGSFNIWTDNLEDSRLPRTSSPIHPSLPKYTDEEKREIWRKRVLLKKPILFQTYCTHRYPIKSYKYGHRQIQRRRVIIDDPRCRTPTPTALKTSWTRFEDVIRQEGILSSPARIECIDFENHSPRTEEDASARDIRHVTDDNLREIYNFSYKSPPLSSSSDSYKALRQEIINKVKKDIAEDNFHRRTPKFSQVDGEKDGRSYWDRLTNKTQSFISRRTPRYKLARKKAQLLSTARMKLFSLSPEPEETSSEHNLGKRGSINPNCNRNASGVSTEHTPSFLDESCHSLSARSSTMSTISFSDSEDGKKKNQHLEQFQIPIVEPSCRRIPRKGKRVYHALDEISEHNEEDLAPGYKDDRVLCEGTSSLHRSWSSNPNLIVIIPENRKANLREDEKHPKLRRSISSPNIKSLTPPIFVTKEGHLRSNHKGSRDKKTPLRDGSEHYGIRNLDGETVTREPGAIRDGSHMKGESGSNNVNTKNEMAHNVKTANVPGTRFSRNDAKDSNTDYGDPDWYRNPPKHGGHEKQFGTELSSGSHGEKGVHFNNDRGQDVQRKPQRFQVCHDPSFRGYGLNDKYHYYKQNNDHPQQPTVKIFKQTKGACVPDNSQTEDQPTNKSCNCPLEHQPLQSNSHKQWREDHRAHGNHPDCPCYDCNPNRNRHNAQTTGMIKRDCHVNRNIHQNLLRNDIQKTNNMPNDYPGRNTQPFPEEMQSNGAKHEMKDVQEDANRPTARRGRAPPTMPNVPFPPRVPQCPPYGNIRFPQRRPMQFYGPPGPFRRMPPPMGVPFPPSLRFAVRGPPFLGMIQTHLPPPSRFPFLIPPMPSRVPRNFP